MQGNESSKAQQRREAIRLTVGNGVAYSVMLDTEAEAGLKTRVEAGSNTSIVTLRVVGGDEKRSLESETVKYGHESYGTRTRK
jgi:hypothetical protein